jgi:hypothetical protein
LLLESGTVDAEEVRVTRLDPGALIRSWVHSHEEDTPDHTVYRPESFPFPPSRGRRGFDLGPDGTMIQVGPGPTDRTSVHPGRWQVEEDETLTLYPRGADTPQRIGKIEALSEDKLVLRKPS